MNSGVSAIEGALGCGVDGGATSRRPETILRVGRFQVRGDTTIVKVSVLTPSNAWWEIANVVGRSSTPFVKSITFSDWVMD